MTTMNPQSSDEAEEKMTTVIADDLHIKGTITFRSSLMIKGTLEGEIISEGLLVVGPTAKIGATIVTKSLVSHGEIKGDVTASDRVVLKGTSVQNGNIMTPYIVVENGSTFNGSCVMKREKIVRPADETGEPGSGGEGSEYEASGEPAEEAAYTGEAMKEEAALVEEAGPGYEQQDTAQAAPEEAAAPAAGSEGGETEPQASENGSETASGEDTAQAAENEEEERKSKEETGGESPLRSKWRRRELF